MENFKIWVTTMFFVGIFLTFVQMIVPNSNLKKYIYTVIGIVTVIVIIYPLKDKLNLNYVKDATRSVINNIDEYSINKSNDKIEKNKEIINENLKTELSEKIKSDITEKLRKNDIQINSATVLLDDEYNIMKINIKILKKNSNERKINIIFDFISKNYGIENDKVTIEEV